MTQEIKQHCAALYDWAEQDDSKRTVLCITSEKSNETDDSYGLGVSQTVNGKMGQMTEALVGAMKEDKQLAEVISKAFLAYTITHTEPAAIGVITLNGKEADNE